MNGFFRIIAVGTLALSGISAQCAVIDDFKRDEPGIANSAALKASIVEDAERGKVLSLAWTSPHKLWVECVYQKPITIPDAGPGNTIAIRMDVLLPSTPDIASISPRILDGRNEVFQWTVKTDPNSGGKWQTLVIPIDPEKNNGHWSGDNDGRISYPIRFLGYSAVFTGEKVPDGRILIGNVGTVPMPSVKMETNRFPFIVNASGDRRCELVISNPEENAVDFTANGTVTDFYGKSILFSGKTSVPAKGKGGVPVVLEGIRSGYQNLKGVLKFNGKEIGFSFNFIVADPVERRGGPGNFLFGICSHPLRVPESEQKLHFEAAAAAGATVMRVDAIWSMLEREPGKWNWEKFDRLVQLGEENGIELETLLGVCPRHAAKPEYGAAFDEALKNAKNKNDPAVWGMLMGAAPKDESWINYVSTVVQHYKGRIRLYEIWNEPDLGFWLGTTDEYIHILRLAYDEIHKADPNALVLSGGFATVLPHPGRAKNPDLQERVLAEASDSFDIHAIHQHGPFDEFQKAVDGELMRMRKSMKNPRPLYFNETALTSTHWGEKTQALTLVKKITYVMSIGAIGHNWYDLINDGDDPVNAEHGYGLLTSRFQPKPAYAAYVEMVRRLNGMHQIGNLDLGPDRHAHVFSGAKGRVVVWWNESREAAEMPVLLRVGDGSSRMSDIMGVSTELPQVDGIVMAQPSLDPQYLELPAGEAAPELIGSLLSIDGTNESSGGKPLNLNVELKNPLSRNIDVKLSWKDVSGADKTGSVPVAANSTVKLQILTQAPSEKALEHKLQIGFEVPGTPWKGVFRKLIPLAKVLGDSPADGRAPDWTLEKSTDVINFCQTDPSLAAFNWKGPDDLSARIWAWRQDGALRMRVDVRDDIHVQKDNPQDSWKGDGIQLALQVPGMKDYWEIGAAMDNDGEILKAVWIAPSGIKGAEEFFTVSCAPIAGGLRYEIALQQDKFGLSGKVMEQGFKFNMIVNDNDGTLREGFVRIAPGIGETKDPGMFPTVRFSKQNEK